MERVILVCKTAVCFSETLATRLWTKKANIHFIVVSLSHNCFLVRDF